MRERKKKEEREREREIRSEKLGEERCVFFVAFKLHTRRQ